MNRKTDLSTALGTGMTLGRRRLLFGAGAIGGAALLTACTGNEPEDDDASAANVNAGSGDNAAPGKEVTIGFSAPAADHGWIAAITTNAKAQAEQYEDVTLNAVEGSNDVNQQISQVETLISQKPNALVILPFDGQALTEVAIRAMEAGIPVINLDRVFSSPRGARAWIGGDNYGMGAAAGRYIAEQMEAKGVTNPIIGEVQGIANLPLTQDRTKGFEEALAAAGMKVSNRVSAEFTVESGQQVTANLLQAAPKLDALWNHDDDQGIGVLAAIDQAGRDEFIMVGGAGSKNAMDLIKADTGVLKATVTYPPSMASDAIKPRPARGAGQGHERPRGERDPGVDHARQRHGDQGERGQVPAARVRLLMAAEAEASGGTPHLGVGMIGYAFMGAAHSQAWRSAGRFFDLPLHPRMSVLCGRNADAASAAAAKFGWERVDTDWRAVVTADDVDLVDVSSPGDTHAEIAIAALEAGKHVLCEKPLANSVAEAELMVAAAERAAARGVRSMVGFNYRRVPALSLARQLVAAGKIGEVRHVRAQYLQDWIVDPQFPLVWRLQKDKAGSGALGDIGAHIVDAAQFVAGDVLTGVTALTETFVKERPLPEASSGLSADRWGDHRAGHGGRRRPVHRPVRRGRARVVRGDPVRDRAQEHDPAGAQRQPRQHRLRLRGDERAAGARRVGGRVGGRVHPGHRHRADAPVHRGVVAAGPPDRLRAHVHARGRRPHPRHRRRPRPVAVVRRRAAGAARAGRRRGVGRPTGRAGTTSTPDRARDPRRDGGDGTARRGTRGPGGSAAASRRRRSPQGEESCEPSAPTEHSTTPLDPPSLHGGAADDD